jgi:hypothetical protein
MNEFTKAGELPRRAALMVMHGCMLHQKLRIRHAHLFHLVWFNKFEQSKSIVR